MGYWHRKWLALVLGSGFPRWRASGGTGPSGRRPSVRALGGQWVGYRPSRQWAACALPASLPKPWGWVWRPRGWLGGGPHRSRLRRGCPERRWLGRRGGGRGGARRAARGAQGARGRGEKERGRAAAEGRAAGGVEPGPQRPPLDRRCSCRRCRSGLRTPGGRAGARGDSGVCGGGRSPPSPGAAALGVPAPGPAPLGPRSCALPRRTSPGSRPLAMKRGP